MDEYRHRIYSILKQEEVGKEIEKSSRKSGRWILRDKKQAEAWRGSRGWRSHGVGPGGGERGGERAQTREDRTRYWGDGCGGSQVFSFNKCMLQSCFGKRSFSGNAAMARPLGTKCCLTCLFLPS